MPKVVCSSPPASMGYIASSDGTVDWLFHDADYGYTEFMDSLDAVVMGRKTWEQAKSFEAVLSPESRCMSFPARFRRRAMNAFTMFKGMSEPSSLPCGRTSNETCGWSVAAN